MGRLDVAIVGAGMIGTVHRRAALLAGATVKGVCASTPERSEAVAADWGVPVGYPDIDAVVSDPDVHVVHICTPNAQHAPYAMAALRAGKHVICEKPLATSVADAEALVEAARRSDLVAAVPFVYRYHPVVREARARVQAGDLGPLRLMHGSYLQDWLMDAGSSNWRVDPARGGPSRVFADIGSHWCDLVEWVSGQRFAEVSATFSTVVPERAVPSGRSFTAGESSGSMQAVTSEDAAAAMFRTSEGVLATVTVSQVSPGRKNRLWFELDGSRASVAFNQEDSERLWFGYADHCETFLRDPNAGSAEQRRLSRLPAGHAQGYADCFEAFVADAYAAIRGEKPEGLPTFDDGLRAARITDRVVASATSHLWLPIDR